MSDILVTSPFHPFTLPTQFKAVFNGYIYCGTVDAVDPSVSQVQVYLVNEAGDRVPVSQPLRTNAGGYLVYNGQPAKFVTNSNHSLLVRDSVGSQVWYEPDMAKVDPDTMNAILGAQVRESLRRSYAEAGYELVAGSFELGGSLTSSASVLLHESSGKAYSWDGPFPHAVTPGTNPASPGFTDRSGQLLRPLVLETANKVSDIEASSHRYSSAGSLIGGDRVFSVLCLGDSNSEGNGQNLGFVGSLMGRFVRSAMNFYDHGVGKDRGFMYESLLNMYREIDNSRGFGSNGTIVSGGVTDSRIRIDDTQYITVTGREIQQVRAYYDPAISSGSMVVTVDGEPAANWVMGASGVTPGSPLTPDSGYIAPTSTVKFTATGGSITVTGLQCIRKGGSASPIFHCAPQGSQGFSDFSAPARVAELAKYINADSTTIPRVVVVLLGTNNMIGTVGKQLTPANYIAQLDILVQAYKAALGATAPVSFVIWVPPMPLVTLPLAPYSDYVEAIVSYCETDPLLTCIRMDKTILKSAEFYDMVTAPTGIHLNELGHTIAAKTICDYFGVPLDSRWPQWPEVITTVGSPFRLAAITSPWSSSFTPARSRKTLASSVQLSGGVQKSAGGGSASFATLRPEHRPVDSRVVSAVDQAGTPRGVLITSSGVMSLIDAAVVSATTQLFFDGISFEIN